MSSLPPEILDLIIDYLHDEPTALKTCCVVSKSWVSRTRKYLFARVTFNAPKSRIARWKKTFPDSSNSPAHHTRTLSIRDLPAPTAADADVGGWIGTFCNVVHLEFAFVGRTTLVPFCGLSPTIRSLRLAHCTTEVFDLVCSFPLLEDLALISLSSESHVDAWNPPPTSPKLTGSLDLKTLGVAPPIARRLLDLPHGLRFSKISVAFLDREAESVNDLVLACSDTLESLTACCYSSCAFPSTSVTDSTSFSITDAGTHRMIPHDLSKATKLKRVKFHRTRMRSIVQWFTMTLQTIESKDLQTIAIYPDHDGPLTVGGAEHQEWNDLDRLLVQFWTTHSIRPRVMYPAEGEKNIRDCVPRLLPELTRRGLVDLVQIQNGNNVATVLAGMAVSSLSV